MQGMRKTISAVLVVMFLAPLLARADRGANNTPPHASAPAATARRDKKPEPSRYIRFQFDGVPYNDVIRRFAQVADRPLVGDVNIEGTLSFFDSKPYAFREALETLNLILATKGFVLRQEGRHMRLRPLAEMPTVAPILHGLEETGEVGPSEIVTVVLPLKFLDPQIASKSVIRMVSNFGSISPLSQGKGIIITDRLSNIERIKNLLDSFDTATLVERQMKAHVLKNASAKSVSGILNSLFGPKRAARWVYNPKLKRLVPQKVEPKDVISTSFDSRTNMLIVVGTGEKLAMAEKMIERLDMPEGISEGEMRVFELKKARPDELAETIRKLLPPKDQRGKSLPARVVADQAANRIIVSATVEQMKRIEKLIRELDQAVAQRALMRIVRLKQADAQQLARSIVQAMARRDAKGRLSYTVSVGVERRTNTLILSGRSADVDEAVRMIEQLDRPAEADTAGVYILPLTSGDAATVVGMIRDLYEQQVRSARQAGKTVEPLAVSADTRANAVIIAAGKTMYETVNRWVRQVEAMKPPRGTMKVIHLKIADPQEVKQAIDQLYDGAAVDTSRGRRGRRRPSPARAGRVSTTVLQKQRAILVSASPEDYKDILALVRSLEDAAAGSRRIKRIFSLENAPNVRVAEALRAVFVVRGRRADPGEVVSINAMPGSNTVLVAASKEKMEQVEHLITQLDQRQVAPRLEFRVYRLAHAQPRKILPMLRQMMWQIRRANPGETIDVQADERTRSVIVTAGRSIFEQIEKLIETLDRPPAWATADVLVIPLRRADAARLAAVLNEMLRPGRGGITPQARALQEQVHRLRVRGALQEQIPELDLTKPIKITADPARPQGTNSLILTSTKDNLKALAAIVEILDTVPIAPGVKLKLMHLKNADAESVARILRDVFRKGKRLAGVAGQAAAGRAEPQTATGKALVRELNVSADARTNSLILAGEEEVLALAELLVRDMDRVEGKIVTEIRLFRLKHADASRLAPLLQSVFTEQRTAAGAAGLQTQVTRLKTYLDTRGRKANAAPRELVTRYPKIRPALAIRADAGTNILVVAARNDVMPLIADVVAQMDVPGAGSLNTVRFFPLENADATRLSSVVRSLYTGPNARLVRTEDRPTVAVDTRTNTLIVTASEKTFSMLTNLVARLDARAPVELRDLRLLKLKNAEAAALAGTLQRMMDARVQRQASLGVKDAEALRVIIVADARSNSLIVGGSNESFQIVSGIAEKLDTTSPALGGQIQILPLKHGNAGTAAATLSNLFNQRYQAARTPDVRRQKPVILPDVRTNSLLVVANQDDSSILKGLLARLDVKLTAPAVRIVVIPMKFNDAGVVAPQVQRIFQARLTSMTPAGQRPNPQNRVDVTSDSLSNSLIISASMENIDLIRELLKKVDVQPPDETGIVRMYALENSDAQRVASMLRNLLSQGLYKPGAAAAKANRALAARERVSLAVDTRTNVLIVSASRENFAILEEVIRKVDGSKDFGMLGNVRVFILKRADATRLAPTLQKFFREKLSAEKQTGSAGRSLPVVIIPDGRTNALLVAGSRESFAAVEAMVARLDAETTVAENDFQVFPLKQATASVVQGTLQRLFDRRATRGRGARQSVTVIADSRSNSLIVGAPPEEMQAVRSLIEQLDVQPKDSEKTVKVFPLDKADATKISGTLRNLYRSRGGQDSNISISVDERTNSILVSGGQADLKLIRDIIKELDRKKLTSITEIRIFPLANADADELAELMMSVLTNKPKAMAGLSPNRQTLLQFIRKTTEGQGLVTSALQEGVLITPDRRTNSLVITAPLENMPLLGSMISSLDSATARSAEIRVFRLENADAVAMADVLEQLFRSQEKVGRARTAAAVKYTLSATQPGEPDPLALDEQDKSKRPPSMTTGSAEQTALNITVDARTNSLIIGGTKYQVDLAAAVIQELDSSPAQKRITRIYRPRNSQAGDIEQVLKSFLDQERQHLQRALGTDRLGAAQRLLDREVSVQAEPEGNTLLISASPRYFQTLARMIDELDQPPAQVLIQALLAEIMLDNQVDLGFEWNWRSRQNDKVFSTGTNMNVQAGITGVAGFNVSITGGDLTFFLRALQAQNRLEILSRPQLVTADNKKGRINIGQRVPLITSSRTTEQGDTINTVEYEDIGVILEVLPRIGSEGTIRMDVNPVISSVSQSFTLLSEFARAHYINNRSAETTITCQDGQTIIIGGLIATSDEDREDKVPILGDIPVMGLLFRSTSKIKRRSELMIFLTPTILRTAADVKRSTLEEFRGNRSLKMLKKNHIFKDAIIEDVKDAGLLREIRKGSNAVPRTAGQRRRTNLDQTIRDLELLPDEYLPPPAANEKEQDFNREME